MFEDDAAAAGEMLLLIVYNVLCIVPQLGQQKL